VIAVPPCAMARHLAAGKIRPNRKMKMNSKDTVALLGLMVLTAIGVQGGETPKAAASKPAIDAKQIFPDDTLCKGKGIEIKRSQVDEAFVQFKANLTARGQELSENKRDLAESQLLDRLVITKLLVARANEEDKKKARTAADKFVASTKQQAGSDESFQRQLSAMNFTTEQFDAQVMERAICEEVVDRELRSHVNITDEQLKKFYDENGEQFERPETVRAAHILLSTRDASTGQEMSEETKKEKRQQIEKILERAKKGEEFAALAREYSDDPGSKNAGGEYTFARGQFRNPEFESAAFALKTNEISGVVTTAFGENAGAKTGTRKSEGRSQRRALPARGPGKAPAGLFKKPEERSEPAIPQRRHAAARSSRRKAGRQSSGEGVRKTRGQTGQEVRRASGVRRQGTAGTKPSYTGSFGPFIGVLNTSC